MWPAKLPGEGATMVDACKAMCDTMNSLGIAIDGGKDSLSMAARVGNNTVKAPGRVNSGGLFPLKLKTGGFSCKIISKIIQFSLNLLT